MGSKQLAATVNLLSAANMGIHSVLIIRNGSLVTDAYLSPFPPHTKHDLASITKSVTSTLIGIAIDKGFIKSVREPLLSFFPDRTIANLDARKMAITLEDLLTMRSGLHCIAHPELTLFQMLESLDWVQFMLDLPMTDEPGTKFVYDSGAVHLLSAIISRTTGKNALAFAREYLFGPLGISDVVWPQDLQGNNYGWGDLRMSPHDIAKLGYLLLNDGTWDGQRVVSSSWIRAATTIHTTGDAGDGYGYLWWMPRRFPGVYEARGRGGQSMTIVPQSNLVVVVTGGVAEPPHLWPTVVAASTVAAAAGGPWSFAVSLIRAYRSVSLWPLVAAAVKSDQPLAENPAGVAQLESASQRAAEPRDERRRPPPLPPLAKSVSGKTFVLESGSLPWQELMLTFHGLTDASLRPKWAAAYGNAGFETEYRIGLDNVPRFFAGRFGLRESAKGFWKSAKTFTVDVDSIGNIDQWHLELTFEGNTVAGQMSERSTARRMAFIGKLAEEAKQ